MVFTAASDDVDRTTKFVSPDISNPGEINEVPETTATANQGMPNFGLKLPYNYNNLYNYKLGYEIFD